MRRAGATHIVAGTNLHVLDGHGESHEQQEDVEVLVEPGDEAVVACLVVPDVAQHNRHEQHAEEHARAIDPGGQREVVDHAGAHEGEQGERGQYEPVETVTNGEQGEDKDGDVGKQVHGVVQRFHGWRVNLLHHESHAAHDPKPDKEDVLYQYAFLNAQLSSVMNGRKWNKQSKSQRLAAFNPRWCHSRSHSPCSRGDWCR